MAATDPIARRVIVVASARRPFPPPRRTIAHPLARMRALDVWM